MNNRMPKKRLFTLIIILALISAAAITLVSIRLIHAYLNPDFSAMTIDEIRAFSECGDEK